MNNCLGCAGVPPDGGLISFFISIVDNPLGIPLIIIVGLIFFSFIRMFFLKQNLKGYAAKLEDVIQVIKTSERGVYKRIDENRELLELLQEECPDFIERHFWIKGWLAAQDRFLSELADVSGVDNTIAHEIHGRSYPRLFPKKDAN